MMNSTLTTTSTAKLRHNFWSKRRYAPSGSRISTPLVLLPAHMGHINFAITSIYDTVTSGQQQRWPAQNDVYQRYIWLQTSTREPSWHIIAGMDGLYFCHPSVVLRPVTTGRSQLLYYGVSLELWFHWFQLYTGRGGPDHMYGPCLSVLDGNIP